MKESIEPEKQSSHDYISYIQMALSNQWRSDRAKIEEELRLLERLENPVEEDEPTKALRPLRDALERRRISLDAKYEGAGKLLDEIVKPGPVARSMLNENFALGKEVGEVEGWSKGYADRVSEERMGYGPYEK